jgi:hypothetical protein
MSTTTTFTFKLCFVDEIRRFTAVMGKTTFTDLETLAKEIVVASSSTSTVPSSIRLSWKDGDDDNITLRSQLDLEECFSFLVNSSTNTLRISIEVVDGLLSRPSNNNNSSSSSSNNTEEPLISFGARKHLEKMDEKIARKTERWLAELEKLKLDPHFDEKEYLRQLQVLQDAAVPVYPLVNLLLAKRLVWNNQRAGRQWSGWSWFNCHSWFSPMWEGNMPRKHWETKALDKSSEQTRKQVDILTENQMPSGWVVISAIELHNRMAEAAKDPVMIKQLAQVEDLKNVPEPLKVKVLLDDANEEGKSHCGSRRGRGCGGRGRGRCGGRWGGHHHYWKRILAEDNKEHI